MRSDRRWHSDSEGAWFIEDRFGRRFVLRLGAGSGVERVGSEQALLELAHEAFAAGRCDVRTALLEVAYAATWHPAFEDALQRGDDHEASSVRDHVSSALRLSVESGQLSVERGPAEVPTRWRPDAIAPPAPAHSPLEEPPLDFIAVLLVDQDGEPVPRRGFHLELPDGREEEGFLDGGGRFRFTRVAPGTATLTFDDLDVKDFSRQGLMPGTLDASQSGPVAATAGGTVHLVERGETLASIAERYGFLAFATIWNAPENAALRGRRDDPLALLEGDEVVIPKRKPRTMKVDTGTETRVIIFVGKLFLRVELRGKECAEPALVGTGLNDVTVEGGIIAARSSPTTRSATLRIRGPEAGDGKDPESPEIALSVGTLPPLGEPEGTVARLRNLGFDAGDLESPSDEAIRLAIEEFQQSIGQKPRGVRDARFLDDLREAHGQ